MSDFYVKLNAILTAREKRQFLLLLGAILLMACLEVVGIASIMPFMQLVSSPDMMHRNRLLSTVYEWLQFESFRSFLLFVGSVVLALMTLSKTAGAVTKWMQHRFVWLSAHSLSTRLLSTYLHQPYAFFLVHEPSKLQKQVIGEVKQLVREVLIPLVRLIAQGIVAVIIFLLLIVVNPTLALIVLGTLGGSYAVIYIAVHRYLHKLGARRFQLFRQSFKTIAEIFGAVKPIKVHRTEDHFIDRFRVVDREQSLLQPKYAVIAEVPQSLIELLAFGGILVILLYLLARGQEIQELIPILSLYALAGHRLIPSLQQSFHSLTMLRFNHSVLESIHQDLTSTDLVAPTLLESRTLAFERSIELRDVSYTYPSSDEKVVRGIHLTIERGSRVAFVGSTGSGKSTLADLLLGILSPTSGEIIIDGERLSHLNGRQWLRMVGYVPQEVVLVDSTIAENIAFGVNADEVDIERVRYVADVAQINTFIERELPDGYETRAGERGIRLSGGQRQRIGLARALYHRPQLLVMDEATSALDGITEVSVMKALARYEINLTVVTIAHRIVTVMDCDRIYLMESGRIVDAGRYAELLESSTVFRGLARVAM